VRYITPDTLAHAHYDVQTQKIAIRLFGRGPMFGGRKKTLGKPMEFVEHDIHSGEGTPPSIQLDYEQAQELLDTLWENGLRPTEERSSVGAVAAIEKHLDDMRTIAFKQLGIEPPPPKPAPR
jgi:hypothetical protein